MKISFAGSLMCLHDSHISITLHIDRCTNRANAAGTVRRSEILAQHRIHKPKHQIVRGIHKMLGVVVFFESIKAPFRRCNRIHPTFAEVFTRRSVFMMGYFDAVFSFFVKLLGIVNAFIHYPLPPQTAYPV